MDLYTLSPSHEDTFLFGTFTTASITPGSFEVNPTYELTFGQYALQATVTFTEEYTVYYAYYTTPAVEEDVRVAEVINDCYFPETGTVVNTETYNTEAKYLNMVIINAAGEYVFVEKVVEPEPLPEGVINSFEFLGQYNDLDDNPDTSGGSNIYLVKCADGNEYKIEVYWAYCNADGTINEGTYNYVYNQFNAMYSGWDGFCIESSETYYGSRLIVEADKITLEVAGVAAYVYTENGAEEPGDNTGGEVEDGVTYVNTFVEMATSGSYNTYFHFKDETGDNEVKFVTCHYDGYVVNDWPKTAEYTWKSSPGYIMNNTFSFMNGSLKVNGTTYVNDDVSLDATASVDADGNVTINFTVGGTAYVFKHNKQ